MLNDFYIEAEELYAEAEDALLDLEKSGNFDTYFKSIFRAFHSAKGAADIFGLSKLQEHMHLFENIFEKRKNDGSLTVKFFNYLLFVVDREKNNSKCGCKF